MGRGRYPTANVPGDFAADRRTATAATTSASVRARCSCVQEQPMGECVQMPAKKARSAPRPPSGLPEVTVAVRIAPLPCREPGKPRVFTAVRESSGESQSRTLRTDTKAGAYHPKNEVMPKKETCLL